MYTVLAGVDKTGCLHTALRRSGRLSPLCAMIGTNGR